ncbi:MAG: hypothetical protein NXI31_08695 [bacterium]|nr:hypothetical protein [bacterium]
MTPTEKPTNVQVDLSIIHRTPVQAIHRLELGFDPLHLSGAGAMEQSTHARGYSPYATRTAADHLRVLEKQGRIDSASFCTVESARNLVNNPRCLAWTRDHGFCAERNEDPTASQRGYYGLHRNTAGGLATRLLDLREPIPDNTEWFLSGTPVLWDDEICDLNTLCTEASDAAHVWQLERTDERSQRLARVFLDQRHEKRSIAADALRGAADGLPRNSNYLHHGIGVGGERGEELLISVIAIGSLERIGEVARTAGARSLVVIDNGGSVSYALRRPGMALQDLYTAWYHRPQAVAVLACELAVDPNGRVPFDSGTRFS